ncbi:MAG: hypothetical protein RL062_464, partial [Bacteroidota bacterium]
TDSLLITVYTLPNWSLPTDFAICEGENIVVNSSQAVEWPNGTTSASYTVNNPPAGTTTIPAILHFGVGCQMTDNIVVTTNALPVVNLTSAGTITCVQTSIACTGTTNSSNFQVAWSSNAQPNITTPSPNPLVLTVTTPGVYHLQCTDNNTHCSNSATVTVNADTESPELTFTAPDTLSCWNTHVTLNHYSVTNTSNYQATWSTTDGQFLMGTESSAVPSVVASGLYTVEIIDNDNGCSQTFATAIPQTIDLGFNADEMVFPNVISKNNDQKNEYWRPFLRSNIEWDFYAYFKVYQMKVYNRWGGLVFESSPAQPYWKADDVSAGDYFYTFEYTTQCGTIQSGKVNGTISVVK